MSCSLCLTAIIMQFISHRFPEDHDPTIGKEIINLLLNCPFNSSIKSFTFQSDIALRLCDATSIDNQRIWVNSGWVSKSVPVNLKPYSDGNCFSVSDFLHIQGVVGDLIVVRIQDVGVLLSPPPWKSPTELPTVFWQTPRSCGNLIAVRIHISEFTRRNRFKIQCLIPVFWNAGKYLKEQYFMTAQPQRLGAEKRRKAHKLSNVSLLWQQQVCNTILKCVL